MTELEKAALTDDDLDCIDMAATQEANQNPHGTHYHWRKAYLRAFANALTQALATTEPEDDAQIRAIGEGLRSAHDHIEMHKLERSHCKDAARIREGLAAFAAYKKRGDFVATTERKGEPSIPAGWVACRIEHEPGYPEDVAYGPQRMMDRLKKWLDKHFANTSPQVPEDVKKDAERWRKFSGLDYKVRREWASNLSLVPVLTEWVDALPAIDAARKGE